MGSLGFPIGVPGVTGTSLKGHCGWGGHWVLLVGSLGVPGVGYWGFLGVIGAPWWESLWVPGWGHCCILVGSLGVPGGVIGFLVGSWGFLVGSSGVLGGVSGGVVGGSCWGHLGGSW